MSSTTYMQKVVYIHILAHTTNVVSLPIICKIRNATTMSNLKRMGHSTLPCFTLFNETSRAQSYFDMRVDLKHIML